MHCPFIKYPYQVTQTFCDSYSEMLKNFIVNVCNVYKRLDLLVKLLQFSYKLARFDSIIFLLEFNSLHAG